MTSAQKKSLIERLGKKKDGKEQEKSVSLDLVSICDQVESLATDLAKNLELQMQQRLADYEALISAIPEEKAFEVCPDWSSAQVECLANRLVTVPSGRCLDGRMLALLKTGHVSAYAVPALLNECIRFESYATIEAFLAHVKDVREVDLVKIVLFVLPRSNEESRRIFDLVLERPFRRDILTAYLRSFGSVQIEALIKALLAHVDSKSVFNWLSAAIDAQYALLAIQPIFLPLLKDLHERIGQAVLEQSAVEGAFGQASGLTECIRRDPKSGQVDKRCGRVSMLTRDYSVEYGVDLL